MRKLVTVTMAVLIISARAQQVLAAGEPAAEASAARLAPAPGDTRFVTRGGETVEGKIIDRLPNGYLVRAANTTRVVAYEDVASIEGEGSAASAPAAPPPPQVQPVPPVAVAPLAFAPIPQGQAPESFGHAGQVIVTQSFGYVRHSGDTTSIFLDPSFNFLVTDMLTLGFELAYSRTSTSYEGSATRTSSDFGALGLVGIMARLSETVSLWPNVGGGISHDFDGQGSSTLVVGGQLALLLHPARHFFIGIGPETRGVKSLEGSGQSFHYSQSLASMIGGWW